MWFLRCLAIYCFVILAFNFELAKSLKANEYEDTASLNMYGMPGEIDLPSAKNLPDGQFSISTSMFAGTLRINLSFQIFENLTGAFRYARIPGGEFNGYTWDRSFDIHYLLNREKSSFPAIAIGVRDFIGTGIYTGEYIVASKSFGSKLNLSTGIGWGRLAGENGFNNVFGSKSRKGLDVGVGGTFHFGHVFSGDNSPFFSINYKINNKLEFISELSPDSYKHETSSPKGFTRRSDINLGVKYIIDPTFTVMATWMYGDTLGLTVNMGVNPRNSPYYSSTEPAPMPILEKKYRFQKTKLDTEILAESQRLLELDGINLKTMTLSEGTAEVSVINRKYLNVSQMVGRVVRILSLTTPPDIEEFKIDIIDFESHLSVSEIVIKRENFAESELEFNGPEELWKTVSISNSESSFFNTDRTSIEKLSWSLYPYLDTSLFDPDDPFRFTVGAELLAKYKFLPSTSISGSLRQPIAGTLDDSKRDPKGGIPIVRSDFMYYHRDISSNLFINYLTLNQYLKPSKNLYALVNVGFLEMMYAGLRAEIIWKNNTKPYGFGLDFAQVQKRDYFGRFKLQNQHFNTYLASMYYDLPNDWIIKIDGGRYLAGDFGSTVSIERTFNNGWEIGAFATLTDVPFNTWGEGSFDKGIMLKAPINWFLGKKSRSYAETVIRPITGDGGAKLRLSKEKYLYYTVSEYSKKNILDNWARVFR
ncbi:YjbH domain-containing protein [Paracoccaceae bacterium]|nr:YjbH domain-containing protein [Paracoccaceae bacterium]